MQRKMQQLKLAAAIVGAGALAFGTSAWAGDQSAQSSERAGTSTHGSSTGSAMSGGNTSATGSSGGQYGTDSSGHSASQAGGSQSGGSMAAEDSPMGSGQNNPLYSKTADDLIGTDVVDAQGKDVGEIENVVLNRQNNEPYVVLSVGGVAGVGGKDVVVRVNELEAVPEDDKIRLTTQEQDLATKPT